MKWNVEQRQRHKVTVVLIAVTWLLAALPAIYLYGISSCRFEYFGDYWRFGFAANEGCPEIPFPTNLPTFIACTCIIIFLDFIAIYRVRVYNREIAIRQRNSCWNKARKHDEVNFLKQWMPMYILCNRDDLGCILEVITLGFQGSA
ncbi:hypothetical protein ANCCAN_05606 [Ancylostoma caninum]|uniref:7TM GPCR serpentine receptor class x (Srx) domain-containing protein n=1 Tax=Ancylostoma caninum TaxID=29170 RepID=A0A368GZ83_ANCCA|nr:hypothetical protein ANCCAN_05606 [Ancylostoma caninum]